MNELAKARKLTVDDIERGALREILSLQEYLTEVKSNLDAVIEKAQKNGARIR